MASQLFFLLPFIFKFHWFSPVNTVLADEPALAGEEAWVIRQDSPLSPSLGALNAALSRHEKLTGETIKVVLLHTLPEGTTLESQTETFFHKWKIGARNRDNGLLIGLLEKQEGQEGNDARILKHAVIVGYGLEQIFSAETAQALLSSAVNETTNSSDSVAVKSAVKFLEELHSPALEQPELWTKIEQSQNTYPAWSGQTSGTAITWGTLVVFLLFMGGALLLSSKAFALETHYTRVGWISYRPRWRLWKKPNPSNVQQGGHLGRW